MLTSTQRDLYFTLHNFKAARWLVDSLHWLADFSSLYSHYSLVGCFVGSPTSRILAHRLALPRFGLLCMVVVAGVVVAGVVVAGVVVAGVVVSPSLSCRLCFPRLPIEPNTLTLFRHVFKSKC